MCSSQSEPNKALLMNFLYIYIKKKPTSKGPQIIFLAVYCCSELELASGRGKVEFELCLTKTEKPSQ